MQFQAPRGTGDILPEEQGYWRVVRERVAQTATRYGYDRIDTPVFEDARLFVRGVGEMTDVMEKETYTFQDRGDDLLTLRPEGTAPVCRAYLEHGLSNLPQPVRLYYISPIFRYERPQAGRFRQHHQFGVEVLGDADASVDAEVIELGWRLLGDLGLAGLSLGINTIGDLQCRPGYIDELRAYYRHRVEAVCSDCRRRLEHNTLRLLDCKEGGCQPIIAEAPSSVDHLCDPCAGHWASLLAYLDRLDLPFQVDNRLVRGFDYYTRTVFEITPPIEGRQSTLIGGGRYDGLIEELGGKPTPGVGFGMGIERAIANMKRDEVALSTETGAKVLVAHVGEAAVREAVSLSVSLRTKGMSAIAAPVGRSLRSQLRYATAAKATHAIIMGDDELQKGVVTVRNLERGEQREVVADTDQLIEEIESDLREQ